MLSVGELPVANCSLAITSNTATSTESRSSRLITSTYTSTNANGGVAVITETSWVNADPQSTASTTTRAAGTLQTNAATLPQLRGGLVFEVVVGAVIGGVLLG
jgi:hypothetical protein